MKKIVQQEEDDDKQGKELKKDAKKWRIKYIERNFEAKKKKFPDEEDEKIVEYLETEWAHLDLEEKKQFLISLNIKTRT